MASHVDPTVMDQDSSHHEEDEDDELDYDLLLAKYLSMKDEGEFEQQHHQQNGGEGEDPAALASLPTTPSTLDPDSPAFAHATTLPKQKEEEILHHPRSEIDPESENLLLPEEEEIADPLEITMEAVLGRGIIKDIDVCNVFPVPLKHEVLLSIIGGVDTIGTPRENEELVACLKTLQTLLEIALVADDQIGVDFQDPLLQQDSREEEDDDALVTQTIRYGSSIKGWVDFLVACGFETDGSVIKFWRPDPSTRPCQRVIIGLQLLREELDGLVNLNYRRTRTEPVMASIGAKLTLLGEAEKRLASSNYFPTFSDLLEWVELRNYFYICFLMHSGQEQEETWLHYFHLCKKASQDVLLRVQSKNNSLRARCSFDRLTADSSKFLKMNPVPTAAAVSKKRKQHLDDSACVTPPSMVGVASPGSFASPGLLLLRTPEDRLDREGYKMSAPVPERWIREDPTLPVGLLNMRQCCYMNSLVQLLGSIPGFIPLLLTYDISSSDTTNTSEVFEKQLKICRRLKALFGYLTCTSCTCINPIPLLEAVIDLNPMFGDYGQHDPHEFADCVMDAVRSVLKESGCRAEVFSSVWGCSISESGFRISDDGCAPIDAEPTTESVQEGGKAALDLAASSSLVPLYFVDTKETIKRDGSAGQSLQRSLTDYFLEVRPDGESGTRRSFVSLPANITFYLPARTSGLPGYDRTIDFPLELNMEQFSTTTTSSSSSPSSADSDDNTNTAESTTKTSTIMQQVHFHKMKLEMLEKELKQAEGALEECRCVVSHRNFLTYPATVRDLLTSAETDAARVVDELQAEYDEHFTEYSELEPKLFSSGSHDNDTPSSNYVLTGLIVHQGASVDEGHYYSFVQRPKIVEEERADSAAAEMQQRNNVSMTWYSCDDTSTQEISVEDMLSSRQVREGVYCLLYSRKDSVEAERDRLKASFSASTETFSPSSRVPLAQHNQNLVPEKLRTLVAHEDARKRRNLANIA